MLLQALAGETGQLADCADRLQGLFGRLIDRPQDEAPEVVEQAQALDGLVQRLDGLQTFLAALSAHPLTDIAADAAAATAGLRLTSQARRLSLSDASPREPTKSGDCDLF